CHTQALEPTLEGTRVDRTSDFELRPGNSAPKSTLSTDPGPLVSAGRGSDTGATGTDERIGLSRPGEAFQFVKSTVHELEPRPVNELAHGRRDPHVVRRRQGHDPRSSVDRDSADVPGGDLNLAAMDARPNPDAKRSKRVAKRCTCADRPLSAIKQADHTIARGLDQSSVMSVDFPFGQLIVAPDDVAPGGRAACDGLRGRVHDVGHENREQRAPPACGLGASVRAHGLEIHGDPWLVTDHPGIVSGRDLEDVTGPDLELGPVAHLSSQLAAEGDPEVMELA